MSDTITSTSLFPLLQEWATPGNRRRLYFRGEKAVGGQLHFRLQPTLVRHAIWSSLAAVWEEDASPSDLEDRLVTRYTRYTAHLIESDGEFAGRTLKQLETLCLAQHHGLPTLLTDWTLNPLIALYFALARDDTGDFVEGPGRLWVMRLKRAKDRQATTIHLEESLTDIQIETKIREAKIRQSPLIVVPLVFTRRIAAQEGRFVYCPHATDSEYELDREQGNDRPWESLAFHEVSANTDRKRELLDVISNIGFHPGRTFPDLSGWAKYLRQGHK